MYESGKCLAFTEYVPDFTAEGVLPIGDYWMTIDELRESMLVHGRAGVTVEPWDFQRRGFLVERAAILVGQLWAVGIEDIFFDGSFVENKSKPGDIDGYFLCPWERKISGELERELNLLDSRAIWTWNRG